MTSSIDLVAGIPGILTAEQVSLTAQSILDLQRRSGQIPWWQGGHADAWNHVECAMALTATGHFDAARAAYRWVADTQLGDGSWFNYYLGDSVKDARIDTNVCAYVAAGLYHYLLITNDEVFVASMWPVLERALTFVLRWQLADGTIRWSLDVTGRPEGYALLTGSSSILHSLRCAVALGERLGHVRPEWELAAGRLAHAVAHHRGAFAPKNEFAMDWYYPILSGALSTDAARQRIRNGLETHVMPGHGVRCVSTNDWVTAAETAECVIAFDAIGLTSEALDLFALAQRHRREDGSYFTGYAYPEARTFPDDETTSYTAAAIILAGDALTSATPAAGLFRDDALPAIVELAEPGCLIGLSDQCGRP